MGVCARGGGRGERDRVGRQPQQLAQAVRAVGEAGGHRGRPLQPAVARAEGTQAQGLVCPAPVIG